MVNTSNPSSAKLNSYAYDSFGNVITSTGSTPNNRQFLTKEQDKTGLIYFGKRYYNPAIGRFITQDPSGMVDGPNVYVYYKNDPVNFVDLWGLSKDKAEPWWIQLEEGEYYGTGFGTTATEYYVQRYLETGNWLWNIPGSVSALWMPETYQATGWTLITAYSVNQALVKTTPKWAHYEHARGPHKYPHIQLGEKRTEVPKLIIDIARKKIINFIKEYIF